jgi:hypothetical protein
MPMEQPVHVVTYSPGIAAGIEDLLDRAATLTPRQARRLARAWRRSLPALEPHRFQLEMALVEADLDGVWTDEDVDRIDMTFVAVTHALKRLVVRDRDLEPVRHAVTAVALATLTGGLTPLYVSEATRLQLVRPWAAAVGAVPAGIA